MTLDGTIVSGEYTLEGGFSGSLRGTLVNDRLRLERVDSRLGFSAIFYGRVARDGSSIAGTWEATTFGAGASGAGSGRRSGEEKEETNDSGGTGSSQRGDRPLLVGRAARLHRGLFRRRRRPPGSLAGRGAGHAGGRSRGGSARSSSELEKDPENPNLLTALGNALYDREDWDGAVEAYEKARRKAPARPEPSVGPRIRVPQPRRIQACDRLFEKARAADPDHWQSLLNLVLLNAFDTRDAAAAKRHFDGAQAPVPGDPGSGPDREADREPDRVARAMGRLAHRALSRSRGAPRVASAPPVPGRVPSARAAAAGGSAPTEGEMVRDPGLRHVDRPAPRARREERRGVGAGLLGGLPRAGVRDSRAGHDAAGGAVGRDRAVSDLFEVEPPPRPRGWRSPRIRPWPTGCGRGRSTRSRARRRSWAPMDSCAGRSPKTACLRSSSGDLRASGRRRWLA